MPCKPPDTIALDSLLENEDMPWAIHGLQRVFAFFGLRDKHVFTVLIPMPSLFPKALVNDLWTLDFLIAIVSINLAHVLLDTLPEGPALGVPKNQPRCMIVNMEKVQLSTQFAMVALFSLFQHGQVLLQIVFGRPSRTVDSLKHLVLVVATPVGSGELHELKVF
jgi:hypothetical protein